MITKLTDQEKIKQYDMLWRTIEKDKDTIKDQSSLITQLSDELAAMTKTLDKAGDMLELMTQTATANREAYEAETQSTMEMAGRITQLEGCLRTEAMRIENLKTDRDEWKRNFLRSQSKCEDWKRAAQGKPCPPAETGYACGYVRGVREKPCEICPLEGRKLTAEESEFLGQNV